MTRAERYVQFKALRERGLVLREIAAETGVAISTVHDVLSDPSGSAARARKRRAYAFNCIGCGEEVVPNGRKELEERSGRCRACAGAHSREVSRLWIVESMREWNRIFGAPPSSVDWNPAHAVKTVHCAWKADRYRATGRPWPSVHLVQDNFGSWNDGLRAAGFAPLTRSQHWMGHAGVALMREDAAA